METKDTSDDSQSRRVARPLQQLPTGLLRQERPIEQAIARLAYYPYSPASTTALSLPGLILSLSFYRHIAFSLRVCSILATFAVELAYIQQPKSRPIETEGRTPE